MVQQLIYQSNETNEVEYQKIQSKKTQHFKHFTLLIDEKKYLKFILKSSKLGMKSLIM
uniref:Uncharacterized protein n=1 Tax=Tetranychus urticae TaxID=32264 RepID=T1JVA7_TETUR